MPLRFFDISITLKSAREIAGHPNILTVFVERDSFDIVGAHQ